MLGNHWLHISCYYNIFKTLIYAFMRPTNTNSAIASCCVREASRKNCIFWDIFKHCLTLPLALQLRYITFGSIGSQEMQIFVCLSNEKFSRAHNIYLSLSGQSQDGLRTVSGQSQVSLRVLSSYFGFIGKMEPKILCHASNPTNYFQFLQINSIWDSFL